MYFRNCYSGTNASAYTSSGLESMVHEYAVSGPALTPLYTNPATSPGCSYKSYSATADSQPVFFLNPSRPKTPFVGDAMQVSGLVGEAFLLTAGRRLADDITITVASRDILLARNMAFLNESLVGLSLRDTNEIFVVSGSMAEVMLTVGHELGHIIKPAASTSEAEEAKAFAFEAAWAKAIFENDVGGLRSSINSSAFAPARNGLHDVAFNFVHNNESIIEPLKLFDELSRGNIAQQQILEGMQLEPTTLSAAPVKTLLYSSPSRSKTMLYGGYLNRSRVQNLPPPHNFFWGDLGMGIYGMYIPMTTVVTLNEQLLRKDIEQMHRTMGHEYSLHHVMGLPDGYVVEALEEAMFWIADECDRYNSSK